MSLEEARETLTNLGLRVHDAPIPTACPPHRTVVSQHPRAGTETTRTVTIWFTRRPPEVRCGLGLPPAPDRLAWVGKWFVENARGGAPEGQPFAPRITLLLGNRPQRTVSQSVVGRLSSWRVCPEQRVYAARTCPFSALEPFRSGYLGPIAATSDAPSDPCTRPPPVPRWLRSLEFVTLTPDEPRSCFDYFAVQLFVDEGRIVAVNLIWAEP